ncbi:tRNA (adenosine(37)-N6)-threonylcarbamoyltransferase complex dimerization subunit type 1 TsaB [Phenylobacterium sp.]|uniref:tRNA (adenosine(37)-N6)-threonylcarbamoyltransferase complex dimerization subunit type 1 TsaB n=1 Tax=Phenylobacterium sp. TaxID=1871053 RepID=UPI0025FE4544|nr:tRNA (adenosine(37)-N6)-threonylcarbamoyltransferase complex dimerization subunit type 1 TsaB [Phenylobacterium sp.]MBX3482796.1 tRNA (adenosine(37)-N6)-threonylcarbamoyltransferase complex dimerization subunit type 1 TsaB [Phenylobacterium sp.]MCW5759889.1 tRNA (adenosine(37)-N6)-threonylcarbamoyltransferase complex dimerization subunit type 1 TsaB [Phenylobacterium sp.]
MVLGLDTCLNACSVAVLDGERVLAHASEAMARGHQERLAPMAQAVMAQAGLAFDRLDRIGATVGPGSFTGLRVGVAFAKGLGSALGVPAVGVDTLEALAAETRGLVAAALDARRDQVYLQVFEDGHALMAPDVLPVGTAHARVAELAAGRDLTLVGSGAPILARSGDATLIPEGCDARHVARLAAAKAATPIRPLYLRAPDARLPGGIAPP